MCCLQSAIAVFFAYSQFTGSFEALIQSMHLNQDSEINNSINLKLACLFTNVFFLLLKIHRETRSKQKIKKKVNVEDRKPDDDL